MKGTVRVALVTLALTAGMISSARAEQYPQKHTGWSVGFGVGGGSATVTVDNFGTSDGEGGPMGNFRVGYSLTEEFSLAYEGNAWSKSESGTTVTFAANTFGFAWFPAEGLALRGGIGVGSTTVTAKSNNVTLSSTESGLGLHGAVGYDFRIMRTFAIGPQLDYGYASFDGGHSDWVGAGLQFNWYFVPRE